MAFANLAAPVTRAATPFAGAAVTPRRSASARRLPVRAVVEPASVVDTVNTALAANPAFVQQVADVFKSFGIPEPVTELGHPAMMGIMVASMGGGGVALGWLGRLNGDKKEGVKQKALHANLMTTFTPLAYLGAIGGILSTAMQGYDVLQSPHAITAGLVLLLLTANGTFAYSGFGGKDPKSRLEGRKVHAYIGTATALALGAHVATGLAGVFAS